MPEPSPEAMRAASEINQGFGRRVQTLWSMAAIIDAAFQPLRDRVAELEAAEQARAAVTVPRESLREICEGLGLQVAAVEDLPVSDEDMKVAGLARRAEINSLDAIAAAVWPEKQPPFAYAPEFLVGEIETLRAKLESLRRGAQESHCHAAPMPELKRWLEQRKRAMALACGECGGTGRAKAGAPEPEGKQ